MTAGKPIDSQSHEVFQWPPAGLDGQRSGGCWIGRSPADHNRVECSRVLQSVLIACSVVGSAEDIVMLDPSEA
jgi:hypothetical protein